MPHLFDPFTIKDVTLRNRVGVAPMCQYWSEDGFASDWHLVHLGSRAVGGAGLIICEATAVTPEGRITPKDAGLWRDEQIEPLARITKFLTQYGAVPGFQIAHAGRKASTLPPYAGKDAQGPYGKRGAVSDEEGGWEPVGPSAVAFDDSYRLPHALTREEIAQTIAAFRATTVRAVAAGYRWMEVHGAHGYLLHEFLSPLSNQRTDEYGGSFDNRIRLGLEITRAMKEVWPENLPLTWRLSATDWADDRGGWTADETVEFSRRLKAEGVDLIDVSSGALVPGVKIPIGPGYQVRFAERVRREAGIPAATVGLITEPTHADAIIREGRADLVMLARQELRDPYWPWHAARALGQKEALALPLPYDYAVRG